MPRIPFLVLCAALLAALGYDVTEMVVAP